MKSFFSGTDEAQVERYRPDGFLWSVVSTHAIAEAALKGHRPEMYVRLDTFGPEGTGEESPLRWTHLGCTYTVAETWALDKKWGKEIVAKDVDNLDARPPRPVHTHKGSKGSKGTGWGRPRIATLGLREGYRSGDYVIYHGRWEYSEEQEGLPLGKTIPAPPATGGQLSNHARVAAAALDAFREEEVITECEYLSLKRNLGTGHTDGVHKTLRQHWYTSDKLGPNEAKVLAAYLHRCGLDTEYYKDDATNSEVAEMAGNLIGPPASVPEKDSFGYAPPHGFTSYDDYQEYMYGHRHDSHPSYVTSAVPVVPKGPSTLGEVSLESMSLSVLLSKAFAKELVTAAEAQAFLKLDVKVARSRVIKRIRLAEGSLTDAGDAIIPAVAEGPKETEPAAVGTEEACQQ